MAAQDPTGQNPFTNQAYGANFFALRKVAQTLPISQGIPRLLSTVQENNVVVVVGEMGSGKTTQLPKAILMADADMRKTQGKMLALTQNRRLAAQLVAERIAEEMDVQLGDIVGIRYRGRNSTTSATRLEVVTDGTLVAAAKSDPSLRAYGAIVIDEAHQHTVATDLLLGLLKGLAETRKDDLKIVIMSATIDAALFTNFFPGSVLQTVSGRAYKVLVSYLDKMPPENEAGKVLVDTILQVHLTQRSGNILVFVPGVLDMQTIISNVQDALEGPDARFDATEIGPLTCWPLHAQLSPDEQDNAVESVAPVSRHGKIGRKLVVATNIAETSITLTGVNHVIDTCCVKSKIWNPRDESWSLRQTGVSKAVANRRAGRAGRTREGMVWRMCTEAVFNEQLAEHSVPAILESDMLSECLHIMNMGKHPIDFPFMVAPASETIVKALGLLHQLGAVDMRGFITSRGEAISRLPIDPYLAVMLLSSPKFGCSDDMLSLVSMIEASEGGSQVFVAPRNHEEEAKIKEIRQRYLHPTGDHLTLFNIYMSWRAACIAGTADVFVAENRLRGGVLKAADRTRMQLLTILRNDKEWRLLRTNPTKPGYYIHILKALAAGNFLRVAKRESRSTPRAYHTVRNGISVALARETVLGPPSDNNEWVLYNEHSVSPKGRTIRLVSALAPEHLVSADPAYWFDAEFLPKGHIQNGLVKVLARMTGQPEDFIRGGMPAPTDPAAAASTQ